MRGAETQALIYNPVTGGLMVMLAEFGRLSLAEVLAPSMQLAEGYPIEASAADNIEQHRDTLAQWPDSKKVFLPQLDAEDPETRAAPRPGEIFRQPDLLQTLQKLVAAEAAALAAGKNRKEAIYAAYDRFYRGDIAKEIVRANREDGGLFTLEDLDGWQVHIEQPVTTNYRGIDVYKLTTWVQGPAMLQALNILEGFELAAMGYNSARYIHTVYQAMNLAFADRDFYYGDPYFPPEEPVAGLLSKQYSAERRKLISPERNDPGIKPGDPCPFQGGSNPYSDLLEQWAPIPPAADAEGQESFQQANAMSFEEAFLVGTTSIQAADAEAHNITSYQMQSSFGDHQSEPGRLELTGQVSPYDRATLQKMGYSVEVLDRTYSPITAIGFDREQGTMQGAASDYGDDYGVAW